MQRQLLQISDRIPDDILLTLLKCFAQILSREPEQASPVCGPFIRAFAKIRDDGSEKQFQSILEDDENGAQNSDDNECTFNYKVSNVVTQEVVYSMGDEGKEEDEDNKVLRYGSDGEFYEVGQNSHDIDHELPPLVDPEAEIKIENEEEVEKKFDEISKENEATDLNVEVNGENTEAVPQNSEVLAENLDLKPENEQIQAENDATLESITENPELPQESLPDDSEKPQNIDSQVPIEPQQEEEEKQPQEERPVVPMQKVTLDDIQREIHEMQIFLFNKGLVPEVKKKQHNEHHHKKLKKIEDSYKVDYCVNLKKKGDERKNSKSKAILTSYLNDHHHHHGKHSKGEHAKKVPIFDPNVPNTPEDFLKEKSVTEKINKKKQKIKHLDVSWQKLCDSQNKVYKHSNFKPLKSEKAMDEPTII